MLCDILEQPTNVIQLANLNSASLILNAALAAPHSGATRRSRGFEDN